MNRFLRFVQFAGVLLAVLGMFDIIASFLITYAPETPPTGDGVVVEPAGPSLEWRMRMLGITMIVVGFVIAMVPGVINRGKRTPIDQVAEDGD